MMAKGQSFKQFALGLTFSTSTDLYENQAEAQLYRLCKRGKMNTRKEWMTK